MSRYLRAGEGTHDLVGEPAHAEEDQSYAKSSLGVKVDEKQEFHKVKLGYPMERHPG